MPSSLFGPRVVPQSNQVPTSPNNTGIQPPANLAQIKMAMNLMKSGGNPQAMMGSFIQNNPQYSQAYELINKHGGDAKAAFYDLAAQKGVDPNMVLNWLK